MHQMRAQTFTSEKHTPLNLSFADQSVTGDYGSLVAGYRCDNVRLSKKCRRIEPNEHLG